MKELRVFGPPGTGKTTRLAERIETAAKKFGSDNVLVSSFTRAAAREIASRGIPVDKQNVGTLHSLCYHALDCPDIAEGHLDEFSKEYPRFALSGTGGKTVENPLKETTAAMATRGDALIQQMGNLRARMIPVEMWPSLVRAFHKAWLKWKQDSWYKDFADLIDLGIENLETAPGRPSVGILDESQDFSRHQMTLVRQWAKNFEYVLFGGDPDQLLYNFAGATPDAFLEPPIPEKQKEVLAQSFRVPRAIHCVAEKWISQIKKREPTEYLPRDFEGEATFSRGNISNPRLFMDEVEHWTKDEGETVMILAPCAYMLQATITLLREKGLPFHNPYRKINGAWNPLQRRKNAKMAIDRLTAFTTPTHGFPPVWSMFEIATFIWHMRAKGTVVRGAKNLPSQYVKDGVEMPESFGNDYREMLLSFFEADTTDKLMEQLEQGPDAHWFFEQILSTKRGLYRFPLKVLDKQGEAGLVELPKIIVGTAHSTKGGESDNVIFSPDLSLAGMREWAQKGQGRDAIIRMTYVAMTRAKKRLRILRPAGSFHVDFSRVKGLLQ